jgi:alcohol dehydrogenase
LSFTAFELTFTAFEFRQRGRVLFGAGRLGEAGVEARALGFGRTLLVADPGLVAAGHAGRAVRSLTEAGVEVIPFHDLGANPDSDSIERGREFAAPLGIDSILALGGGSSLDFAKGVNFLLTNGGRVADYRGYGRARRPLLPMLGVPTTSGTGSEAQSYAVISDAATGEKMACGDPGAAFRLVILDPELTYTQPRGVTATAGFDALAHAVETCATTKRNSFSEMYSREAWRLLVGAYERVLARPDDSEGRARMQLGAYLAGAAVEGSMLGAAHACANPLTARYGTEHGAALAMLLPSVVRWNAAHAGEAYAGLTISLGHGLANGAAEALARRLEELVAAGGLVPRLGASGVPRADLPTLASDAARQWTGRFNPRPFDERGALEIYQWAY